MNYQDTKFNYKILLAALIAVVIGILIAVYYSHAQSQNKISFLQDEKLTTTSKMKLMYDFKVPLFYGAKIQFYFIFVQAIKEVLRDAYRSISLVYSGI